MWSMFTHPWFGGGWGCECVLIPGVRRSVCKCVFKTFNAPQKKKKKKSFHQAPITYIPSFIIHTMFFFFLILGGYMANMCYS